MKAKFELSGGFHNVTPIRVVVNVPACYIEADGTINKEFDVREYMSDAQCKRVDNHFCGNTGECLCGGCYSNNTIIELIKIYNHES